MFKFFDGVPIKGKLGFFLDMFRLAFIHLIQLSVKRPLGIIFENFQDVFDLEDSGSGFS
jgi:hypothetical protein